MMPNTHQYLHWDQWENGIAMYAPMPGPWHSSTRMELAGLIMAAQAKFPIHVCIDNKAVVDRGTQLLEIAMEREMRGE